MPLLQTIVDELSGLQRLNGQRITVVGIDGPTAAGKSTLAT